MPCFLVIDIRPDLTELPPDCQPKPEHLVRKYGGTYVVQSQFRNITAWPSEKAAMAFINAPECVECRKKFREMAAGTYYLIEAKDKFSLVTLLL